MCSSIFCRLITAVLAFALLTFCADAQQTDTKAFSATSNELIGLWAGEGEVIEFRGDGKCRYAGELYSYQLSQGHLLIEIDSDKVLFSYSIKNGKLHLTAAGGQQSTYTKMTSGVQTEAPPDQHPADLLGTWCYIRSSDGTYTDRCITLQADGTYLYQHDQSKHMGSHSGTWFVKGSQLYYQSATAGAGSFKLERRNHPVNKNDPMIVLNDEPFVTTVSRPPWK